MRLRKKQKIFAACALSAVALLGISACALIDAPSKSILKAANTAVGLDEVTTKAGKTYSKVKSNTEVTSGNYIMSVSNGFLKEITTDEFGLCLVNENNLIEGEQVFHIEPLKNATGYTIKVGSPEVYLGCSSSKGGRDYVTSSNPYTWKIDVLATGDVEIKNTSGKWFAYNGGISAVKNYDNDFEKPVLYKEKMGVEYKVSFKDEDKTLLSSATVYEGETVERPLDPVKANTEDFLYTFKCWLDADGNEFNFETPIKSDLELFASYNEIPNTVENKFQSTSLSTEPNFKYTYTQVTPEFLGGTYDLSASTLDSAISKKDSGNYKDKGRKFSSDGNYITYAPEGGIVGDVKFTLKGKFNPDGNDHTSYFNFVYLDENDKPIHTIEQAIKDSGTHGFVPYVAPYVPGTMKIKMEFHKLVGNINIKTIKTEHMPITNYSNFRDFHLNFGYEYTYQDDLSVLETGVIVTEGTTVPVTNGMNQEALDKVSKVKQVVNELTETQTSFTVGVEFNRDNLATYYKTDYAAVAYIKTANGYYFSKPATSSFEKELTKVASEEANVELISELKKDLSL